MAQEPFDIGDYLPYRMTLLAARMSRGFATVYESRYGLSNPEWRVIAHVAGKKGISVRELSHQGIIDKSVMSRTVKALVEKGLVAKRENPEDRRLLDLALTKAGRAIYDDLVPLAQDYEAALVATLKSSDLAQLEGLMQRLHDQLEELENGLRIQ